MSEEIFELKEPKRGDVIRIDTGKYFHYGIYVGSGEVVEFGHPSNVGQKPEDIKVIRQDMSDFLSCGGFVEVKKFTLAEKLKKYSREQTVKNALLRLGEGGYDILTNNCRHFAYSCAFKP